MKIFNWVHKRFHHKDEFAENAKKAESVMSDAEKQALLEVGIVDVLDGWKDGILAIGTFGFDPLKPLNQQKICAISDYEDVESDEEEEEEYFISNEDDYDNDCEDESEVNPLVFQAFAHTYEEEIDAKFGEDPFNPDLIMAMEFDGVGFEEENYPAESENTVSDEIKKKGERITLADLFMAEADDAQKNPDFGKIELISGKKQVPTAKGLSFAKKFIPRVGEDSRPIKKLNRLMRKMLKRKIHPELEGKEANKMDGQIKPSILELLTKAEFEAY